MKKKNMALLGATSLTGVIALGTASFVGNYFYDLSLNRNSKKRAALHKHGDEQKDEAESIIELEEEYIKWFKYESNFKNIFLRSDDNLRLHACEVKKEQYSKKWVILLHGYLGNCEDMAYLIQMFSEKGYNVLAPDLRGHGLSDGTYVGMGWHDRKDLMKWIDYIIEKDKDSEIVLHGISMGAGTVMMTVGEKLPKNVKVAIEDCGYTSACEEFTYQLAQIYKRAPKKLIIGCVDVISKIRAGYRIKEASAIEQLRKSKIPMLFIHGDQDEYVPSYMLDKLYEVATCPKDKLIVKGAGHAQSIVKETDLYWEKVFSFLHNYIED